MFNAPSRGWRPRRGSRFGCDARQAGRSAADALYPTSELRVLLRSAPVDENQGDLHGVSAVPVTRCAFGTSCQARTRGQIARPLFGFNQATETPFTQTARLGHAEIAMHRGFMHSAIVLVRATFESDRRHLHSDKPVSGEDDRYAPWSVDREVMDDRAVRDHERVDPVRQSTNQFPVLLQGDRIAGTDCSDQLRAFPAALRATVASPSPSALATAILQRIPMVRPERVDQSPRVRGGRDRSWRRPCTGYSKFGLRSRYRKATRRLKAARPNVWTELCRSPKTAAATPSAK